jgi:uncharacterized protein
MARGKQAGEEGLGGGVGLGGDVGEGDLPEFGEAPGDAGDVGGFGERLAVFVGEGRGGAVGMGAGKVGGVGFEQEASGGDGERVLRAAAVVGAKEGAAEGDEDVAGGEGGEGVGGAGVGVDEQTGGMGGEGEENVEHAAPGIAAMEAGGEGEFAGEVELGAEDGFAFGVEAVVHAAVEADLADAGGAFGEGFAEVPQPVGGAVADEPRVQAKGAEDAVGIGVGEGSDGGPVGLGGGSDVHEVDACGFGAFENGGQMGGEARILEVAVGVDPSKILAVRGWRRCYGHSIMFKWLSSLVNPQRWAALGLAAACVAWGAGCGTFNNYPAAMEGAALEPLRTGKKLSYEKAFDKQMEGRDGVLYAMEKGRAAQLRQDYSISRAAFERAIERTQEQDDEAVIAASGAAAQTGAVMLNDNVIPYRAPSYERTLVHHYQALNYLMDRDLAGASVEVRRANREQEAARKRHEEAARRAGAKADKGDESTVEGTEDDPSLAQVYAGLNEAAGAVKFSFQNAATFYLSGVTWEMLGELNDAYIDYKKAIEIFPDNAYLRRDVVRLGKRLGMREDVEAFSRRFPDAADTPAAGAGAYAGKARLVVFYEQGLVPPKTDLTISYPISSWDALGAISLPTYANGGPPPVPAEATLGGSPLGWTEPICNVAALAARALAEQMPGILTRQVARAVAKGVSTHAAKEAGGEWAGLAMTIFNLVTENADLRSWLTLPAHVHVLSAWTDAGERVLGLSVPGAGPIWTQPVTLEEGKTTLVVVSKMDLAVYSKQLVQP